MMRGDGGPGDPGGSAPVENAESDLLPDEAPIPLDDLLEEEAGASPSGLRAASTLWPYLERSPVSPHTTASQVPMTRGENDGQ